MATKLLADALREADVPRVKDLLQRGADPNAQVGPGIHFILLATAHPKKGKNLALVNALLDAGANPNIGHGTTSLHLASKEGNLPVVQALLAKDAAVNVVDDDGATPLYFASGDGHLPVMQALLAKGAAVDAAANDGAKPLHIASHNGHLPVVQALLAKGAAVDATRHDSVTPLCLASQGGHLEVVQAPRAPRWTLRRKTAGLP